ncbi:hypothetical protein [Kitasatospora sp. KL5]|uniref:hypothetical protein n=1 Tax=Kitasatospora sp. KL5 TaxID=3425125 RepID=UPI003D6DAE44
MVTGEHDVFLPPGRLATAGRKTFAVEPGVVSGAGHLLVEEHPEHLAGLPANPGRSAADTAVGQPTSDYIG